MKTKLEEKKSCTIFLYIVKYIQKHTYAHIHADDTHTHTDEATNTSERDGI